MRGVRLGLPGICVQRISSLTTLTDEVERELSLGYAWFWTFLFSVALALGILSWMIKEGRLGNFE